MNKALFLRRPAPRSGDQLAHPGQWWSIALLGDRVSPTGIGGKLGERKTKGWTQEELANRAKLDKQTICRLEAESSGQAETRQRTVDGLANALKADPSVITGKTPLAETQDDEGPLTQMSRLNFRVSTQARNALYLISERYNVAQSNIVELAPYLFCWAAEASLRQRKERVADLCD